MSRLWWNSQPGRRYRVLISEDMITWLPAMPERLASGPTSLFVESYDERPLCRFYKVELLP